MASALPRYEWEHRLGRLGLGAHNGAVTPGVSVAASRVGSRACSAASRLSRVTSAASAKRRAAGDVTQAGNQQIAALTVLTQAPEVPRDDCRNLSRIAADIAKDIEPNSPDSHLDALLRIGDTIPAFASLAVKLHYYMKDRIANPPVPVPQAAHDLYEHHKHNVSRIGETFDALLEGQRFEWTRTAEETAELKKDIAEEKRSIESIKASLLKEAGEMASLKEENSMLKRCVYNMHNGNVLERAAREEALEEPRIQADVFIRNKSLAEEVQRRKAELVALGMKLQEEEIQHREEVKEMSSKMLVYKRLITMLKSQCRDVTAEAAAARSDYIGAVEAVNASNKQALCARKAMQTQSEEFAAQNADLLRQISAGRRRSSAASSTAPPPPAPTTAHRTQRTGSARGLHGFSRSSFRQAAAAQPSSSGDNGDAPHGATLSLPGVPPSGVREAVEREADGSGANLLFLPAPPVAGGGGDLGGEVGAPAECGDTLDSLAAKNRELARLLHALESAHPYLKRHAEIITKDAEAPEATVIDTSGSAGESTPPFFRTTFHSLELYTWSWEKCLHECSLFATSLVQANHTLSSQRNIAATRATDPSVPLEDMVDYLFLEEGGAQRGPLDSNRLKYCWSLWHYSEYYSRSPVCRAVSLIFRGHPPCVVLGVENTISCLRRAFEQHDPQDRGKIHRRHALGVTDEFLRRPTSKLLARVELAKQSGTSAMVNYRALLGIRPKDPPPLEATGGFARLLQHMYLDRVEGLYAAAADAGLRVSQESRGDPHLRVVTRSAVVAYITSQVSTMLAWYAPLKNARAADRKRIFHSVLDVQAFVAGVFKACPRLDPEEFAPLTVPQEEMLLHDVVSAEEWTNRCLRQPLHRDKPSELGNFFLLDPLVQTEEGFAALVAEAASPSGNASAQKGPRGKRKKPAGLRVDT